MVVLAPSPTRTVTRPTPAAGPCDAAGTCPAAGRCPGVMPCALARTPSGPEGFSVAVAQDGAAARRALDARDRERCARLSTAGARRDFRAGRLAARRAVTGLADGSSCPRGVRVSLAHRDGRGLAAAVGPGAGVGVDLEREGTVVPAQARYFLTHRERVVCGSVDPTELWTLKESVWKLFGLSRSVRFHALEAIPRPSEGVVHVRHRGGLLRVSYRTWRPWPGWIGTVVWCGGQGR